MQYKTIDRLTLPVLGLGTGGMGPNYSVDKARDDARINAIKTAIEQGITHIDTAERYGGGRSEELISKAIKGCDREKLFITTKVLPEHLKFKDVISSANASVERLGTYIDLYLVHKPNPEIDIYETMAAMDELVYREIVKRIGISNFSSVQVDEAQKICLNKLVANQIEYSLLVRNDGADCKNMELDIIPYCRKNQMFVITYKPLAWGELAKLGHAVLDEIAKKYNKTQAQVSLNWLISQENIVVITRASQKHIEDNLGALGWKLEHEDFEKLTKVLRRD